MTAVVTDKGITIVNDFDQQPFLGALTSTLVGVQNNSSTPIASLALNGSGSPIMQFNGNGLCSYAPVLAGCPFGPTGYEGPGVTFSDILSDLTAGNVNFSPSIPPGGRSFFSLATFITATSSPLSMTCNPDVGPSQLGVPYATTCSVTGGPLTISRFIPATPVFRWALIGLPIAGLALDSSVGSAVTLRGVPTSPGPYSFTIQVSDNSVPFVESASQAFSGTVGLLGGQCNTTLSSGGILTGPEFVSGSVFVSSPVGCPAWRASSPVSWVTIDSGAQGTGNGRVDFTVFSNGVDPARSTTLAIAGHPFTVSQLSAGCLTGITPQRASIAQSGGAGSVAVGVLSSNCAWSAAVDANSPWLTINGASSGTGIGAVNYSVTPNPSATSRTGTITIAGQTFTVVQSGSACSFSLPKAAQPVPSEGGLFTAAVQAPAGCVWPPTTSNVPWVTINSATGSGSGTVTYSVQVNPGLGAFRTGTVTVAGHAYAVTQTGAAPLACVTTVSSPPQVALEGRTELVGDLLLSCTGIVNVSSPVDIGLTFNTNVTDAASAVLTVNGSSPLNGRISGSNTIHWPSVPLTHGTGGVTTVQISGIRVDASQLVASSNLQLVPLTAEVAVNTTVPVPISNPVVVMANAGPQLRFQRKPIFSPPGGGLAIPVVFQETAPAAFQAQKTRLRVVLKNVPASLLVYAAAFSSEGTAYAQLYSADFNGAGGAPINGVALSPLTVTDGVASATWVVQYADPAQFEQYTFPIVFYYPTAADLSGIQVTASLAPVGDTSVPRYRDLSAPQKTVNLRTTTAALLPPTAFGVSIAQFRTEVVNDNQSQAATNVVVRDVVSPGGNITGCQAIGGFACTVSGNEASANFGTVQPGQSVTLIVTVQADSSLPADTVIPSVSTVQSDQPIADLAGTIAGAFFIKGISAGGQPASMTASFGTPQSATVGTAFANPLQVTVKDPAGNPVAGTSVTFSAPASGASATLSSVAALTNASGVASVTATANNIAGSYTVSATLGGLSATFALTNLAASANPDLAQGKPATQSSTYPGYTTSGAASAVDGNTDGSFGNGSVTATNSDTNAWWQVDLGASTPITSIVIWNRTDCCSSRLGDYWVFVSDTPFLATDTPATLQNRPGTFARHQTGAPSPSTTIAAATQGRYVRVQLDGTNYLSLAEVQVFAVQNLARGKTAAESSTLPGFTTSGPASAVDGNTNGAFYDGSVASTNTEPNAWWQVDLGASTAVGSVVVWNRTDCCGTRLNDYWVFVSDTPFLATDTPATLRTRAGTFSSHQTTAPGPSASITVGAPGRYVRVQLDGANYLSLAEVQVFGPGGSAPTRVATQSSTFPGYASAAAASAVDGNPDGAFYDGSVTATNLETNAWWQVDLGASTTINSIVIWNRTDCCGTRLGDFWVFVSDTPFLATDTPATLRTRAGTFSSHQTTAPAPAVTIPVSTQGRYVRVQLDGTNYLSLAEVQVQ